MVEYHAVHFFALIFGNILFTSDSVPVLSHQSLLALSSYIKSDTTQSISYEIGIPYEDIIQMKVKYM